MIANTQNHIRFYHNLWNLIRAVKEISFFKYYLYPTSQNMLHLEVKSYHLSFQQRLHRYSKYQSLWNLPKRIIIKYGLMEKSYIFDKSSIFWIEFCKSNFSSEIFACRCNDQRRRVLIRFHSIFIQIIILCWKLQLLETKIIYFHSANIPSPAT